MAPAHDVHAEAAETCERDRMLRCVASIFQTCLRHLNWSERGWS